MPNANDTTAKLTWFWKSAYPGVAKYIPFERIANKAWKEANPDTYKEIGSIGVMHLENLYKTLKTEQGREYYAKTLDLPASISVDLDNNQQQPTTAMDSQTNLERTFLVQCSEEQLVALGNWMYDNGIFFNKCSDKLNEAAHKETFPAAEAKEDNGTVRP